MRWIVILLLLGSTLQAQEKEKTKGVAEIVRLLESGDPEKREQAIRMLRSLDRTTADSFIKLTFSYPLHELRTGAETMTGSLDINGKRTNYTLRSLGKGRYKLEADVTDENGEKSKVQDEGTLAELRKKYEFLGQFNTVRLPARNYEVPKSTRSIPELGIKVKRPGADLAWHFYVPPGVGYVVTEVDPLLLGHKLGLKPHDLLLKIDGRPIESKTELAGIAKGRGKLEVIRRAKPATIKFPADE